MSYDTTPTEPCEKCNGTGRQPKVKACELCHGWGRVPVVSSMPFSSTTVSHMMTAPCPNGCLGPVTQNYSLGASA